MFERLNELKTFLFQNFNLIEIDKDRVANDIDSLDRMERNENEVEASSDGIGDVTIDNEVAQETEIENALKAELSKETETALEDKEIAQDTTELVDNQEYETIVNNFVDDLNQDELASQISDEPDESTIINNDNYDNNNDSAYETNGINSQNGSSSRIPSSSGTNDVDVDNETGENFSPSHVEIMQVDDLLESEMENFEIERLNNELENPPTPTPSDDNDDVVVSAEKPKETGDSTTTASDPNGNKINDDEVHN